MSEPIPGLARRIIDHTRKVNANSKESIPIPTITEAPWEVVYSASPISSLTTNRPPTDDMKLLWDFTRELDRQLDQKTLNEWAKNLIAALSEKPKAKSQTPFWRR
jgi:hypothetical protein